ncbi:GD17319 [Drosophila simulans]|uniref:GD17319 n=1 Tax=Drosophila simulans TaxID=7240 RepID=B4R651_DROSI|nr:GD17319 [Drosophila simulans]
MAYKQNRRTRPKSLGCPGSSAHDVCVMWVYEIYEVYYVWMGVPLRRRPTSGRVRAPTFRITPAEC